MKTASTLILFLWVYIVGSAQITLTGTVLDEDDFPLIACSIVEVGTDNGTITDFDGNFSLGSDRDTVSLEVSYVGFATQRIENITESDNFTIILMTSTVFPGCGVLIEEPHIQYRQNYSSLERKELNHNPVSNISEPFNTMPGVTYQSGTLGTNRLTIRGIGSRNQFGTAKILGYWNGIPLTNTRGELAIEDLNLDFVDRAEVMRGPTSPQYGSALGGVVLLGTVVKRYNGLDSRVSIGSYNHLSHSHRAHITGMDNRLQASLGFASLSSDGFRVNNSYQRKNINGQMTFNAGRKSNVLFSAFFFKTDVLGQIPSTLSAEVFAFDPSQAASNWAEVGGFEDFVTDRIGLSVQYSTVSNWHFQAAYSNYQTVNDEVRPFNTLYENRKGDSGRFTATKEELFKSKLKLETGIEVLSETRDWNTSIGSNTIDDFIDEGANLMEFVNLRYSLDNDFEINLGASSAQHRYQLYSETDTSRVDYGMRGYYSVNPSLKVSHKGKANTLQYLSIARGFSPPNSDEILTSAQRVNLDILPESGWTFEVGVKNYRNKFQYDVTAYFMPTANLLVPQRITEELTIGVNAGKTRHFGLEIAVNAVDWKTGDVNHTINGMLTYSRNLFTDFVLDGEQFSGNEVTGIPPVTAAAKWVSSYKGFSARVDGQYRSALPINDANTVYADGYVLINASLGYQYQFENKHAVTLSARVNGNNLSNVNYASMVLVNARSFGSAPPRYYYPGMPRNVLLTLGVSLELE